MEQSASDSLSKLVHLIFDDGAAPMRYEQLQPYLNQYMRVRRLKKSEIIARAGQSVHHLHILLSGGAYIMRHNVSGTYTTIARVPAPDMIGSVQIFSRDPLFYSDILASGETLVLEIDHNYFHQCVTKDTSLALLCLSLMSRAQQRSSIRLEVAQIPDSADRLAVYLYRRWLERGRAQKPVRISDKHAIIASDIGISLRTLYRAISKLEAKGLLTVDKGGVLVLSLPQLEDITKYYLRVTVPWD